MKNKFLILSLVLCLAAVLLCACGGDTENKTPDETTPAATDPATEPAVEPTDKGIFVTEDIDNLLTLPEEFQGLTLPEDEFTDDVTGVFESHPVTDPAETQPEETQPEETQPSPTNSDPRYPDADVLPEHVFED